MAARIFKTCGVYQIKCLENGMIYIGSSKHITQRWNNHKYALNRGIHTNPFLQADWKEYGEEKFEFSILEETTEDTQYICEQKYLDTLRPFFHTEKGYNIAETARKRSFSGLYIYRPDIEESGDFYRLSAAGCKGKYLMDGEHVRNSSREELYDECMALCTYKEIAREMRRTGDPFDWE